ncbi:hypothetical protein BLNAU_10530 [Blattamonas nauphoetae]|uniref:Uncharacterized protein n=1 Tax=Blattamonas nauphoetae TaxID=2049346 RepID=A0ABQ9XSF3_9EUKA|nr:hypothetical protein BLNAU_10530 [Blattamonas nauphoetae]
MSEQCLSSLDWMNGLQIDLAETSPVQTSSLTADDIRLAQMAYTDYSHLVETIIGFIIFDLGKSLEDNGCQDERRERIMTVLKPAITSKIRSVFFQTHQSQPSVDTTQFRTNLTDIIGKATDLLNILPEPLPPTDPISSSDLSQQDLDKMDIERSQRKQESNDSSCQAINPSPVVASSILEDLASQNSGVSFTAKSDMSPPLDDATLLSLETLPDTHTDLPPCPPQQPPKSYIILPPPQPNTPPRQPDPQSQSHPAEPQLSPTVIHQPSSQEITEFKTDKSVLFRPPPPRNKEAKL